MINGYGRTIYKGKLTWTFFPLRSKKSQLFATLAPERDGFVQMNELSWHEVLESSSGKIEYRVCSEKISWRGANNFKDVHSALFHDDGAYNMFHSYYSGLRVEEQREKYGDAYYCAVWVDTSDAEGALLMDGNEIVLVSREQVSSIPKTSVYNFKKWNREKRDKEISLARTTKDNLQKLFNSATKRLPFSEESIYSIISLPSSHSTVAKPDLSSESGTSDIIEDLLQILDVSVKSTDSLSLAKSRVGQGVFRSKLIRYWNACAVTGCKSIRLLKASHIKPWANSNDHERLDVFNGLLLVPGIDTAFDFGFVTFFPDGAGKVSDELSVDDRIYLGIYKEDFYLTKVDQSHEKYLRFHNEHVFEQWKK